MLIRVINSMKEKEFLQNYFNNFNNLTKFNDETINKLVTTKKVFLETHQSGKKIMVFGNGGSAAIANHFSVDLTKNAKVRCTNYNESDLITCFSNDFGYEKWIEKTIEFYGDKEDVLVIISASGKSENIVNGCKAAKKMGFKTIITLTGHDKNNPVAALGDINFNVNSKAYNHIENAHQVLLLSLVDLIIGKSEYLPS
tara:strand:- start:93 stop:686 length:594 start_codon:yes stop_codon:yes gene_type:complete